MRADRAKDGTTLTFKRIPAASARIDWSVTTSSPYVGSPSGRTFTVNSSSRSRLRPVWADTGTTSSQSINVLYASISGNTRALFTRSTLLIRRNTAGPPALVVSRTCSITKRSPGPGAAVASTMT